MTDFFKRFQRRMGKGVVPIKEFVPSPRGPGIPVQNKPLTNKEIESLLMKGKPGELESEEDYKKMLEMIQRRNSKFMKP